MTGIMMSHFKMSPKQIKNALLAMDESVITHEKTIQLLKNCPTPEDVRLLAGA